MLKMLTELHHIMRVKELGEVESEEFDEDDDGPAPNLPRCITDFDAMSRLPNFAQMDWALPEAGDAWLSARRRLDDARRHRARPRLRRRRARRPRLPRHHARPRRPICAGRIRPCMSSSPGPSANMPASRPPRSRTPSTAAIWPPGRRASPSPSTSPPIAAMTATIRASRAMSAWRASRSTRSTTCARCSTASRSAR